MANKNSVYKKRADGSFQFWGYLPTEDVVGYSEYSEKIADIITQLGGKANAFGVVGDGLSFNNNTITIDTDVMATREWVKAQGYSSDQIVSQQIEDIQHEVTTNSENIKTNKASIDSLTNDVANRYTKAEADGRYVPLVNGTSHRSEGVNFAQKLDIGYDEIVNLAQYDCVTYDLINNGEKIGGLGKAWWYVMSMKVNPGDGYDYMCQLALMMTSKYGGGEEPRLAFRNKTNLGLNDWEIVITDKTIASQHVAEATTADKANSVNLSRTLDYDIDSFVQSNKVGFNEINNGTSIGGLGWHWWHVMTAQGPDTDYATQLAIMMSEGGIPQLAFRNKLMKNWRDWAVAITDKTIGDQTVKSFTTTEVNHGCKFNGDVSSTTCSSAPMMVTTGKLTVSSANEPNATKTTKTKGIRMGNTMKTITCPMNPFMEYFFDHGYHFDNGEEGNGSEYDVGIVAYSNRIYYCVFQLNSDGSSSFTASPLETLDETGNSKFLLKKDGTAEGLVLNDNQLGTAGNNTLTLPEKSGTLATIGDFYDGLGSNLTNKALTANQGKVLDGKISSLSSSISGIKFIGGTNVRIGDIGAYADRSDDDLYSSITLNGGYYGCFYVIFGLENGHNSDYGKLVVKTSSTSKADMTTNTVAAVSGETGYWKPQWLSLAVIVPAKTSYYLYGCRMTKVYYSYSSLEH